VTSAVTSSFSLSLSFSVSSFLVSLFINNERDVISRREPLGCLRYSSFLMDREKAR